VCGKPGLVVLPFAASSIAAYRYSAAAGASAACASSARWFAALADPAGVIAHRPGALERVQLLPEDWQNAQRRLAETDQRMICVVDELGLTRLRAARPSSHQPDHTLQVSSPITAMQDRRQTRHRPELDANVSR
jgi:hypothetical protein